MLQIQHLTLTHRRDGHVLLNDFSFTLNQGDRAALVGEEGDGKSTLLKLIYDERLIADYADYTGRIVRAGQRFGYLAQELPEREAKKSVRAFCAESRDALPAEFSKTAAGIGLNPEMLRAERAVGTLSGGEKVKLQLACILAGRPDALLLDEPSNDLDLDTLGWLEHFLNTCGLPALYVSHDETLLERTANVIVHLEQVRRKTVPRCTVARMPYRQYVEERLERLDRQGQIARKEQSEYEKQMEKFRRIREKVECAQASVSRSDPHGGQLMKKKMKSIQSMGKRFERERTAGTDVPDTEDAIAVRFADDICIPNGKTVLDLRLPELSAEGRVLAENVRLHVEGPEKVCMIGKNGAGKTTLLRAAAQILLARDDVKAAYMPQNYGELLRDRGDETPAEFLSVTGDRAEKTRIRTLLGSMKYTSAEMEHGVSELSGGQKAKLLFLRMIFTGCNVLVLDEPTRNFSPLSGPVIRDVLRAYRGAIISVSHDRKYIGEVCTRVLRLTENGLRPVSHSRGGTDV